MALGDGQYSYSFYPNYWCASCHTWVTYNGHVCTAWQYYWNKPVELENKPKYEEHTLECGCKVKTVVVEHCDTLHKAPEEE